MQQQQQEQQQEQEHGDAHGSKIDTDLRVGNRSASPRLRVAAFVFFPVMVLAVLAALLTTLSGGGATTTSDLQTPSTGEHLPSTGHPEYNRHEHGMAYMAIMKNHTLDDVLDLNGHSLRWYHIDDVVM
jgi:hypothetical protein